MLIRFKETARVDMAQDRLLDGLSRLATLIGTVTGATYITVTSWSDSVHKTGSLHYSGGAVDVRSKIYPPEKV